MVRLRKINWLLLILLFSVAAWPGYTLLKGLTFSKRKLKLANPVSYVFNSPASAVRSAIDASASGAYQEGGRYGSWAPSGLSFHGSTETEYNMHQITVSNSYFWWNTPLQYTADFKLLLTPVSDSKTRVDVQTSESMVRIGPNFGGHGGDYYERVAPTTIEEYRILLKIGAVLGEQDMPRLRLPL
jgi:hypothetical protein